MNLSDLQGRRGRPQQGGIADGWIFVTTHRHVKVTLGIFAVEAVVAGFVEVNQPGSAFNGRSQALPLPHLIVVVGAVMPLMIPQVANQQLHLVAHTAVHVDQLWVNIP